MSDSEPKGCLFLLIELLKLLFGFGKSSEASSDKNQHLKVRPYRGKEYLLTKAEVAFFNVLHPIVEKHMHLFAMVRLADLVYIARGTEKRQSFQNRVNQKHVDFVLCQKGSLKPVLAIELDDSSHQRPDRQKRDRFLEDVLEQAELPLLRVPVRASYDVAELKRQMKIALTDNAEENG